DGAGIDALAAMHHLALRQRMADEHGVDRLQIELGGEVHHREIFVVELAVLLRRVAVAGDEVTEEIAMRLDMAVEVHPEEAGDLEEAGIDLAHEAGMRERHRHDDVTAEPAEAVAGGERLYRGRL